MSWLSRAATRLAPAERRDWAEALWAEADEVPPGLARLAWRAGGIRLIAREALLMRRAGRSLVFAAAAAWVAWAAWPGPAGNIATAVARVDVVTVLAVLAGLPLLVRWRFGPPAGGPAVRVLRAGAYAAVLALTVAKARVEQVVNAPPVVASQATHGGAVPLSYTWFSETIFVLIVVGYMAAVLVMTARRSPVAPATLAIGTGAGVMLGVVMCAVTPLGLAKNATEPWLAGSAIDPVVALAWILLLGGPIVAGGMAGWCYRGPGSWEDVAKARAWQGVAAGFLMTGLGALVVAVAGTGTIALMTGSGWLLHWLYPGQHLSAAAAYGRELTASMNASGYGQMLLIFPVIGLVMGVFGSAWAHNITSGGPGSPPGGGGPPGPKPAPDPPGGARLACSPERDSVEPGSQLPGCFIGDASADR